MSTGERAAGGLEALQREWRGLDARVKAAAQAAGMPYEDTLYLECAETLAPHISAEKEREEKLRALVEQWNRENAYCEGNDSAAFATIKCANRLAAILKGGE